MTLSYPPFPTDSSISAEIIALVLWMIEIPFIAVANVIIVAMSYIGSAMGSSAASIISFPGQIFAQTENSFKAYGIFAMPISAAIWGVSILILVFFIFKIIQVSGDEITNEE